MILNFVLIIIDNHVLMSDAALHVCMDTESPNIPQLRVSYRLSVRGAQCNNNVDNNKYVLYYSC